jgi:site-specific recombinase XerD
VILYRAGLRVSEALSMLPKDIDAKSGTIRVLRGKNKTSRLVGLDAGALAVLECWLERRARLAINKRGPLFCTLDGEPMKTAYVRAMIRRVARKAGIARRVHAHALRHSFAFELANERTPMHVVQAALGHRCLTTTQKYVSHLNPTAVVEAIRSREWTL